MPFRVDLIILKDTVAQHAGKQQGAVENSALSCKSYFPVGVRFWASISPL